MNANAKLLMEQYKKETGQEALYKFSPSLEYVEWLEDKVDKTRENKMKTFQIYLNLSGEFDDSYTVIRNVESLELSFGKETSVLVNGSIEIDFGNEILGITEVSQ